jgi:hypothetical protein
MKKILIIFSLVIFMAPAHAQSWNYNAGENPFNGKYRSCSVMGEGYKYPYKNPLISIIYYENPFLIRFYISDAGYAGCDNKSAYLKFDGENKIYQFSVFTNNSKEIWVLGNSDQINFFELIDKMKKYNNIYVRLESDCSVADFIFSLSGSSKAIDYTFYTLYKKKEHYIKNMNE